MLNKLLIAFLLLKFVYSTQLEEGDICDSGSGVCSRLAKCPPLIELLKKNIRNYTLCGTVGVSQIVCCPSLSVSTTEKPKPMTKSYKKCVEYSKAIYERIEYFDSVVGKTQYVNETKCFIQKTERMIVGGKNASLGEFPHMAYVGRINHDGELDLVCGGSLLSERYVLSAAHCTNDDEITLYVRLGELNILEKNNIHRKDFRVINIIQHEQYRAGISYHDIALLKLNTTVIFTPYIRPICLPEEDDNYYRLGIVSGWGSSKYRGEKLPHLQKATLDIINYDDCITYYNHRFYKLPNSVHDDSQICAYAPGNDTCGGDSGGPLLIYNKYVECSYTLVGLTVIGRFCGSDVPSLYGRIKFYKTWIENIIWED